VDSTEPRAQLRKHRSHQSDPQFTVSKAEESLAAGQLGLRDQSFFDSEELAYSIQQSAFSLDKHGSLPHLDTSVARRTKKLQNSDRLKKSNPEPLKVHLDRLTIDLTTEEKLVQKQQKAQHTDLLAFFRHQRQQRGGLHLLKKISKAVESSAELLSKYDSKRSIQDSVQHSLRSKHPPQRSERMQHRSQTYLTASNHTHSQRLQTHNSTETFEEPLETNRSHLKPNSNHLRKQGSAVTQEDHPQVEFSSSAKALQHTEASQAFKRHSILVKPQFSRRSVLFDPSRASFKDSHGNSLDFERATSSNLGSADLKLLAENLQTFFALFPNDEATSLEVLTQVTRNNPCCEVVADLVKSKRDLLSLPFELFLNRRLILNLPLMIVDLKEYLLERRISKLEHGSKEYLSNSIDYMRACKNYQSRSLANNLQAALKSRDTDIGNDLQQVANGETMKYLSRRNRQNLNVLMKEMETSKAVKIDKVNEYWRESNQIVAGFVEQLMQPDNPMKEVIKMDPKLVRKYQMQKQKTKLPSFAWQKFNTPISEERRLSTNHFSDDDINIESKSINPQTE